VCLDRRYGDFFFKVQTVSLKIRNTCFLCGPQKIKLKTTTKPNTLSCFPTIFMWVPQKKTKATSYPNTHPETQSGSFKKKIIKIMLLNTLFFLKKKCFYINWIDMNSGFKAML
jgi:hypothetical protein